MKKKILVAPLNWGLGHATRCIPIINALISHDFEPIIASDGQALELLKKEFPELVCLELPSYHIEYSKKGYLLKIKLLKHTPKILQAIKAENEATKHIVETYDISGIISDNRFGVYHKLVTSVFITHQLQVLSGNTTWLSTKINSNIIRKFDECWVPDMMGSKNLSGKLGHFDSDIKTIKHIGVLSRFQKLKTDIRYDIMIVLSGPEPQRGLLEEKLLVEFKNYKGSVLFVKGIIEKEPTKTQHGTMTICNFLMGNELEKALNESEVIVSRSGYTTIMDLAQLDKKAYFIPTPGQFEQEYLAQRMSDNGVAPSCSQEDFKLEKLKEINNFKGFEAFDHQINFKELFLLFESK